MESAYSRGSRVGNLWPRVTCGETHPCYGTAEWPVGRAQARCLQGAPVQKWQVTCWTDEVQMAETLLLGLRLARPCWPGCQDSGVTTRRLLQSQSRCRLALICPCAPAVCQNRISRRYGREISWRGGRKSAQRPRKSMQGPISGRQNNKAHMETSRVGGDGKDQEGWWWCRRWRGPSETSP